LSRRDLVRTILDEFGNRFSRDLNIDLTTGDETEVFKWFIASVLFGARITEKIAIKTYRTFEEEGILSPEGIAGTGWDGLVQLLDSGGYARYDFKTATKLLAVVDSLIREYRGRLGDIHRTASDPRDLEKRLKELGKGIGDVTVGIFLRELRGIWEKADPLPQPLSVLAARKLGFTKIGGKDETEKVKILKDLKRFWIRNRVKGKDFIDLETALVRLGKDFYRRKSGRCLPTSFLKRSK
jgi:hypothetical protein